MVSPLRYLTAEAIYCIHNTRRRRLVRIKWTHPRLKGIFLYKSFNSGPLLPPMMKLSGNTIHEGILINHELTILQS